MDSKGFDSTPFSYEILDEEAAKISKLILAVQEKCANAKGADVSQDLFWWAEELSGQGRAAEAEFLYLHAINVFERNYGIALPITFISLREFARGLLQRASDELSTPNAVPAVETLPCPFIETNAA